MPQLHFYVDDELAERILREADEAGLSIPRYLVEVIQREVATEWPNDYFEAVIGGWVDEPLERAPQGTAEVR